MDEEGWRIRRVKGERWERKRANRRESRGREGVDLKLAQPSTRLIPGWMEYGGTCMGNERMSALEKWFGRES